MAEWSGLPGWRGSARLRERRPHVGGAELESQRKRAEQCAGPRPSRARRRGPRKRDPNRELAQSEPETPEVGPPTEQRQPAAVDSFAAIEARRLDSYENYLDSNQARRGQLTPAETRALDTDTNEKGLRLGADDYVTKPFSAQELVARVEAVLRRVHPAETSPRQPTLVVGDLGIDFLARRVTVRGREVRLSPTEYRLLTCLAARPGTVLRHRYLLETVWGTAYRGEHEILRIALWRLRHKLEKDPSNPRTIITRPGVGYMLSAPKQTPASLPKP